MVVSHNNKLKEFLEEKYKLYANPRFITDDPIQFPHRYSRKEDIEIAGILTATLSWGTRKMIVNSVNRLLQPLGDSPYEFILNYTKKDNHLFKRFVHRTFNESDCIQYLTFLKQIYIHKGGLENLFFEGYKVDNTIKSAIDNYRRTFIELNKTDHTLKHVPNVSEGSAAKRFNMFLRWMVRPSAEGVDFGLWKSIPTSALKMPLDVHSGRTSREIGLLTRKQNDWKSVEELTSSLCIFDSNDPVKYDFALFGLGVNEKLGVQF